MAGGGWQVDSIKMGGDKLANMTNSNSAYGFTAENFMRTLPSVLAADKSILALAAITASQLAEWAKELDSLRIYARIDCLPEWLLDTLAYDFKVDWWDADYTIAQKRQTLKESWGVHRKLGTPAAVERAISAIYPNSSVAEWFEYGGMPYHFKLNIDISYEGTDPERHARVLDKVEYYKNLRSQLDSIDYVAIPEGECVAHIGCTMAETCIEVTAPVHVFGI
jgi:phage tail P2-like protein